VDTELGGWRIDYDDKKGFHVNWWDRTAGGKRKEWNYGAITVEGATEADYYELLSHFPG
jgi:hypothetical protein